MQLAEMSILILLADVTTSERSAYNPGAKFAAYSLIGLLIILYVRYKNPKDGLAVSGSSFRLSLPVHILSFLGFVLVPSYFIVFVLFFPTQYMVKEDNMVELLFCIFIPMWLIGMWVWLWHIVGQRFQFTDDGFILVSSRKLRIYAFKEFRSVGLEKYNMVLISLEGSKLQIPFWYKNSLEIYHKLQSEIGKS